MVHVSILHINEKTEEEIPSNVPTPTFKWFLIIPGEQN